METVDMHISTQHGVPAMHDLCQPDIRTEPMQYCGALRARAFRNLRAPWAARQDLAATPSNSRERFQARRDLPALAKRMREVRLAGRTALPSGSRTYRHDLLVCSPAPRRTSECIGIMHCG